MSITGKLNHIPALDGVRGLAILLVLAYHFIYYTPIASLAGHSTLHTLLVKICYFGWTGVDLFFVLSGFLITRILLHSKNDPAYFRNFYARRALRIFPLYYAVLLIIFVVMPTVGYLLNKSTTAYGISQIFLWTYTVNIAQLFSGGVSSTLPFGHVWSLCVEEHYYLVWPSIIRYLNILKIRYMCIIVILIAIITRILLRSIKVSPTQIFMFTLCRLDTLAIGSLLATFIVDEYGNLRNKPEFSNSKMVYILPFISLFLLLIVLYVDKGALRGGYLSQIFGFTIIASIWGGLLASILISPNESFLNNVFTLRFLRLLGVYSYGLYVLHPFVQEYTFNGVFHLSHLIMGVFGKQSSFFQALFSAMVFFSLSFSAAVVSYHVYEMPWLKLKRLFGQAPPKLRLPARALPILKR